MSNHRSFSIALCTLFLFMPLSANALQNQSSQYSDATVGWTNEPPKRGSLDIIFSCLFTIIACTWSIQHLDVPESAENLYMRMIKHTAFAVFFPEYLFTDAFYDWLLNHQDMDAITNHIQFKSSGEWIINEKDCWKQKLRAFRRSGLRFIRKAVAPLTDFHSSYYMDEALLGEKTYKPRLWTFTHTVYSNMRGWRIITPDSKEPGKDSILYFKAHHIAEIDFDLAYSPLRFFSTSEDEILDKSKQDWFAKMIAFIQVLRFLTSVGVRKVTGLPSSQLELVAIAFAAVALPTYLLLWSKPKGINVPTIIRLDRFSDDPHRNEDIHQRMEQEEHPAKANRKIFMCSCISFMFLAAVVGGIHGLAWNFDFPTRIELAMWRSATVTIAALPTLFALPWLFIFLKVNHRREWIGRWHKGSAIVVVMIYCLARLCILGIAFSSLRALPAGVYLTTWLKYLPILQ